MRSRADRRLLPLSIKTRIGYDRIVVKEWISTLLEERPAAITLHGRTLQQGYKGMPIGKPLRRRPGSSKTPGRCCSATVTCETCRTYTGAFAKAKSTVFSSAKRREGNPWLFAGKEQVKQALRGVGTVTPQPAVSLAERFNVILEHSRHYENVVQNHCFDGMRKNLLWYCCDFPGAAELQWQMKRVNSADDVEDALENYIGSRTDTLKTVQMVTSEP